MTLQEVLDQLTDALRPEEVDAVREMIDLLECEASPELAYAIGSMGAAIALLRARLEVLEAEKAGLEVRVARLEKRVLGAG